MLRYLGMGPRAMGDCPMPPHKRVNWEFLAVLHGKCAPFFRPEERPVPASDRLWLFPPGYVHGWIGEPGRRCEVLVVHYNAVPAAVERLVQEHGFLAAPLTASDRRRLGRLGKTLRRHYWHPILLSDVYAQRALMDLCLLILRGRSESRQPYEGGASLNKIVLAEQWLRDHLAANPTILAAARAAGLSGSQLRRLFARVRKERPKQILNKVRFEKAMRLMAETDAKLDVVAGECGFSNATSFCRAFKTYNGKSPTVWRKEIYIQYKRPREAEKADHASHGRRYREP